MYWMRPTKPANVRMYDTHIPYFRTYNVQKNGYLREVGFEPTRIAPQGLKSCALTTQPLSHIWDFSTYDLIYKALGRDSF